MFRVMYKVSHVWCCGGEFNNASKALAKYDKLTKDWKCVRLEIKGEDNIYRALVWTK